MAQQHIFEDPTRFEPQLAALEDHKDIFKGLYVEYNKDDGTVGGLRRRRRRAGNTPENPIKTVSLVEEDGVLFWRDGVPASGSSMMRRKRASAGLPPDPDGTLVLAKQFPVLAPNKVTEGIGTIDQHLNPWIPPTLRSRLRPLRRQPDDKFVLDTTDVAGPICRPDAAVRAWDLLQRRQYARRSSPPHPMARLSSMRLTAANENTTILYSSSMRPWR